MEKKNINAENEIVFVNENGEEIIMDDDKAIENESIRIYKKYFSDFVGKTSFQKVAEKPVWNAPYIGMHEDGRLHIFTKEVKVNTKKFIMEKIGKEQLTEYGRNFKDEITKCNLFLNNIAKDGEKISVETVKEKLNLFNAEIMQVNLKCTDDNDKEYTLTCTNKMVRVMLVDKAKANKSVDGFKRLKVADFIDVILNGLSKEYAYRTNKD